MLKIFIVFILFVITNSNSFTQTWIQTGSIPDGAGVTDIVVIPSSTILVSTASWSSLSGTLGGVRRSTDAGNTWDNVLEGFNGRTLHLGQNGVVFASFWPFPMDEAVYRSTNDGVNWTRLHSVPTGDNIFSITSKDNNNTIFIGTRNGIKRSTNAGVNWFYVNTGIPANSWVRDLEVDTSSGTVLAATTNGLFSTTNNGALWQMATGIDPQDTVVKISFDYSSTSASDDFGTRAAIGTIHGDLYDVNELDDYLVASIVAIFGDDEITGFGFFALQNLNQKLHGVCQFSTPANLNQSGGFFISTDGKNFTPNNAGLPNLTQPSALTVNTTTMRDETTVINFYMGSFENAIDGAKIYKLTYMVGIQQISSEIPASYSLSQNYPNPFNPSTKIRFNIPRNTDGTVKLAVYDIIGKEVAVLVNSNLSAGSYEYTFNGMKLSSGVYFYKLQTKEFTETKIMLLVK